MVKVVEPPNDEKGLKKLLHERIEQLDVQKLSLMNRVLLKLEAEDLAERLDAAFDQDRKEGKLSSERVDQIISQVRKEHPYR